MEFIKGFSNEPTSAFHPSGNDLSCLDLSSDTESAHIEELISQVTQSIVMVDHRSEKGNPLEAGNFANAFITVDAWGRKRIVTVQHNLYDHRDGRYTATIVDPDTKERYEAGEFAQVGPDSAVSRGEYIGARPAIPIVGGKPGDKVLVFGERHSGNLEFSGFKPFLGEVCGTMLGTDGNTYLTSTVDGDFDQVIGISGSPVLRYNPDILKAEAVGTLRYVAGWGTLISPIDTDFDNAA